MMKILSPKGALLSVTKVEPLVEKRVSFNGSQLRLCQVAKDNYQLVTGVYLTVSSVDTPFMPANIIVGNLKPAVVNDIMNKLLVEGNYDFSQLSYQKSVPFVDKYKYDDYYYASKEPKVNSDTITLKDTAGNDIAVVTMGIKETAETHLIGGKEGKSYKATGMEPTVDIKMADGVTDWTVSVTEDDNNTLHINAVKSNTAVSSDSYTVNLGAAQTISADTFAAILAENATKDVVIKSGNDVTFTFAKGTMANVAGKTEYDFSTSINSIYADTMPAYVTKDNFISQINYNYSGKLPATANIRFYAGTQYAGQTLYYSLMNADNTFAEVQAVVVDADGYMTVKQDHCSSYVVTKTEPKLPSNDDTKTDDGNISNNGGSSDNGNTSNNDGSSNNGNASASDKNASSTNTSATSPKTGDMTPIAIYVVMAVAVIGVIVFVKRRKTA